jgi:hypothetical protein
MIVLLIKVLFGEVNFYHFKDESFQKRPRKSNLRSLFGVYIIGKNKRASLTERYQGFIELNAEWK